MLVGTTGYAIMDLRNYGTCNHGGTELRGHSIMDLREYGACNHRPQFAECWRYDLRRCVLRGRRNCAGSRYSVCWRDTDMEAPFAAGGTWAIPGPLFTKYHHGLMELRSMQAWTHLTGSHRPIARP